MLFGFSTGALHKQADAKQALQKIREIGCNAVELGFVRKNRLEQGWLAALDKSDLIGFEYVSLHAPKLYYQQNQETSEVLDQLIYAHKNIHPLDLVVFHPDNVMDIEIFKKLPFPIGFENMDRQKPFGRYVEEIKPIVEADDNFHFVFDVNHIKTLKPSRCNVDEFYDQLGHKLAEYHISGLDNEHPHIPLFQTKQTDILDMIRDLSKPIICESGLTLDNIIKEKNYIKKYLNIINKK